MNSTVLRTLKALGLAGLAAFAVTLTAACNETSPTQVPGVNQQDNGGEEEDDGGDD
jgi:DNA-binding MurR/RpiR family transcriptional regulator